jgi:hypothetical protein
MSLSFLRGILPMAERDPPELSFNCWLFKITAKGHVPVRAVKRPIIVAVLAVPLVFLIVGLKADLPTLGTLRSYIAGWTWPNSLGRQ